MYASPAVQAIDLPAGFNQSTRVRARWTVSITEPMLLISQVQRSGGHLLAWLFDGHPAVMAHPHELKWGRPKKSDWPSFEVTPELTAEAAFGLLDERWQAGFVARGGFHRAEKTPGATNLPGDAPLYPFVFDTELHRALFVRLYERRPPKSRRDVLNAYLTASFNAWLDYRALYAGPKQWVTAFIPRAVMTPGGLDRFFADYPDGRLVSIVRHPGSWFASAIGRNYSSDPAVMLPQWRSSVEAALQAAASHPEKVSVVLFEDLVHRTADVMSLLCSRLGLAFDSCLLAPTFNGMPVLSNSSHQAVAVVDPQATERYRTLLAPSDAAIIDRMAVPLYERAVSLHGLPAQV